MSFQRLRHQDVMIESVSLSTSTAIHVKDLSAAFLDGSKLASGFDVLHDLSYSVQLREFVSIIGRSGCGKTTLLKLIGGLLPKGHHPMDIQGKISVLGKSPQHAKRDQEFGIMFQTPRLFPWLSGVENVRFPLKVMGKDRDHWDADELLEIVGLQAQRNNYPQRLSAGEQQRLAIARALIYKPSILLMDEPFTALDDITRQELSLDLLRIKRETEATVLFVTHNLRDALFLSDRVIILKPTQSHEQGGPRSEIQQMISVPFPLDRDLDLKSTEQFNKLEAKLRREL